jgi:hypothetical protein
MKTSKQCLDVRILFLFDKNDRKKLYIFQI